jgi:hypothetical protein
VRIIALGHQPATVWRIENRKTDASKPLAPGEKPAAEGGPRKVAVEVRGHRFDYLPSPLHVSSKGDHDRKTMRRIPLVLNAPANDIELKRRDSLSLKLGESGPDGKVRYRDYITTSLPAQSTNVLVTLIARHAQKQMWEKPTVLAFDTSPRVLPGGSLFVFNSTPFAVEMDVPIKGLDGPVVVDAMQSRILRPGLNKEGRTIVISRLVAKDGVRKRQFYYNTLPMKKDERTYLLIYADPKPKSPNPAGVVMFRDKVSPALEEKRSNTN